MKICINLEQTQKQQLNRFLQQHQLELSDLAVITETVYMLDFSTQRQKNFLSKRRVR